MATRFELVLPGENLPALRAAGEEALNEVDRIENLLSLYRPTSEVARLNALAGLESVRVDPELFRLLERARDLSEETNGLFDLTIAPLMRCWGLMGGHGNVPERAELEAARSRVGMRLLELNPSTLTVRFKKPGMMLDFGAIGKGYAIERAALLLREAGISSALIHGGTSTAYGLGSGPEGEPWKVAVEYPLIPDQQPEILTVVALHDESLSVSAVWGKFFSAEDNKTYGHVMDPRSGEPVSTGLLSAVVVPEATDSDALSTALLAGSATEYERFAKLRPNARILLMEKGASVQSPHLFAQGMEMRKRGLKRI
jgi:thiamine biosynthesis lipoprotein